MSRTLFCTIPTRTSNNMVCHMQLQIADVSIVNDKSLDQIENDYPACSKNSNSDTKKKSEVKKPYAKKEKKKVKKINSKRRLTAELLNTSSRRLLQKVNSNRLVADFKKASSKRLLDFQDAGKKSLRSLMLYQQASSRRTFLMTSLYQNVQCALSNIKLMHTLRDDTGPERYSWYMPTMDNTAAVIIQAYVRRFLHVQDYKIILLHKKLTYVNTMKDVEIKKIESNKETAMKKYYEKEVCKNCEDLPLKEGNVKIICEQLQNENKLLMKEIEQLNISCAELKVKQRNFLNNNNSTAEEGLTTLQKIQRSTRSKLETKIEIQKGDIHLLTDSLKYTLKLYNTEYRMKRIYLDCISKCIGTIQQRRDEKQARDKDLLLFFDEIIDKATTVLTNRKEQEKNTPYHSGAGAYLQKEIDLAILKIQSYTRKYLLQSNSQKQKKKSKNKFISKIGRSLWGH